MLLLCKYSYDVFSILILDDLSISVLHFKNKTTWLKIYIWCIFLYKSFASTIRTLLSTDQFKPTFTLTKALRIVG